MISDLNWKSVISLPKLLKKKLISLPGRFYLYEMEVSPKKNVFNSVECRKTKLTFTCLFNHYDLYKFTLNNKTIQQNTSNGKSHSFSLNFIPHDLVEKKLSIVFQFYNAKKSWSDASQLCKDMGGHLPFFTSK